MFIVRMISRRTARRTAWRVARRVLLIGAGLLAVAAVAGYLVNRRLKATALNGPSCQHLFDDEAGDEALEASQPGSEPTLPQDDSQGHAQPTGPPI